MEKGNRSAKAIEVISMVTSIYKRGKIPHKTGYLQTLKTAINVLTAEKKEIRPKSSTGAPGGIVNLKKNIPTIIVPDLHGRVDFFLSLLMHPLENETSVIDLLDSGKIQIVCVGDAFHAEKRAAQRWKLAFLEYQSSFRKHARMDEEMRENLGLMEMIMLVKIHYPEYFHFLKGNHENIKNENANGNRPFGKFAYEGEMVKIYMNKFYGREFIDTYDELEKSFPLLTIGRNFLISHAEPGKFYRDDKIIDYMLHPEVVYDFTWTPDNGAEEGSVSRMLDHYLGQGKNFYYFGGHRPVKGLYNLRADNKYVQIHNPGKFIIAYLKTGEIIDPERDIFEIKLYKP